MVSKDDIQRLRKGTSDAIILNYLREQDAGFKDAVRKVESANPNLGLVEEANFAKEMIDLYYKIEPDVVSFDPLTTQMANASVGTVTDRQEEDESVDSFANDARRAIQEGADDFRSALDRQESGEQGLLDTAATLVGETGQAAGKIFGSAITRGVSALTPDFIEDPIKKKASELLESAASSEAGQRFVGSISSLVQGFEELKREDPKAAARVDSILGIGSLALTLVGAEKTASAIGKTGKSIAGVVGSSNDDIARSLVEPKLTQRTVEKLGAKNRLQSAGLVRSGKVLASEGDERIAAALAKVGGLKKKDLIGNIQKTFKRIGEIGDQVEDGLRSNNVIFPKKELKAFMKERIDDAATVLDLNEENQARKIFGIWDKVNKNAKGDALSTWKTIQKFDDELERMFGSKVFNPNTETARTLAVREVRQGAQEFIESQVSKAGGSFIPEIREMGMLYRAAENMASKLSKKSLQSTFKKAVTSRPAKALATGAGAGVGFELVN